MTMNECRWLRIAIVTLGLLIGGARYPDRALAQFPTWTCEPGSPITVECVPLTFVANVQVSNLHPAVSQVLMRCEVSLTPSSISVTSSRAAVVNRAMTGTVTAVVKVPKTILSDPANRTTLMGCQLQLVKAATATTAESIAPAVASATQPVGILDTNWTVVAADSTILWTETVTITNASPAP